MVSKVIISRYAQQQLDDHVLYVLLEKGNPEAYENLFKKISFDDGEKLNE